MDDAQKERLTRNEDVFRTINDRISESAEAQGSDSHVYEFLCECSDPACVERVALSLSEYEHVRAQPRRFVVKNEHVLPEIEHVVEEVVERAPDHVLIEKHGVAGRLAIELESSSGER